MKKYLKILLVVILFSITTNVKAFSTYLSGDKEINENATVTVNNPESIKTGNNVIEISVIAENGAEQIYKINAIYLDEVEEEKIAPDSKEDDSLNVWLIIVIIESLLIVAAIITSIILIKKEKIIIKK